MLLGREILADNSTIEDNEATIKIDCKKDILIIL